MDSKFNQLNEVGGLVAGADLYLAQLGHSVF